MEPEDGSLPPPPDPYPWASLPEPELLNMRISDLGVRITGSELEPRIAQLKSELEARGLLLVPIFYLSEEWFSPEGVPAVAIPFYLAHPRLKALEEAMMSEVEGGDPASCQRLLRHECGHAIEHAFELHRRRRRKELFGSRTSDYDPEVYRPQPYSRSFVHNLPKWYAQAHPDEDWAETFAVWLDPDSDWRKRYRGWKALAKLEYVDELMRELAGKPPKVKSGAREGDVKRLKSTLASFYKRRKRDYAEDMPDFHDRDLRQLFGAGDSPTRRTAAVFLRRHRKEIVDCVSRWTNERKVTIELLTKKLTDRADALGLTLAREEAEVSTDVAAYLATLVTTYRFTGRFVRSV